MEPEELVVNGVLVSQPAPGRAEAAAVSAELEPYAALRRRAADPGALMPGREHQ
eukprot:gene16096-7718_t